MPKELNKSQKQAVDYIDGPLLIVAGAGTGKTTVISEKIVHLMKDFGIKPEEILALTFTDKSAEEMQERVDALLDVGYLDLQISTFHVFCQNILERYGLDIGLPNQFKLVTDTDAWLLMKNNLYDFDLDYYRPLGNPSLNIYALIAHFSKCKDELVNPEQYLGYTKNIQLDDDNADVEKGRITELANAYHRYNQLLLEHNALDFGDLIFYTIKLLRERPNILKNLQERFKYILVDEFQDVNYAQYELVKILAENSQLTVVGDDDQSVYAFRGASVSNILRFKDDFPKGKEIVLKKNYRSNQEILDFAYGLIQNNNPDRLEVKLEIDKKLESVNDDQRSTVKDQKPSVVQAREPSIESEVQFVVEEILKLKKEDKKFVWDDVAILVRANSHAGPFIQALEQFGIPYEFLASAGLYRQPIVMDCFNFFKTISDYHDSTAVYRLLRLSFLEMRENDIQKILFLAKKKSISYYEALKRCREFQLSEHGVAICDKLVELIHHAMQRSRFEKPTTVLIEFLENSGYLAYLTQTEEGGDRNAIRKIRYLKQFFEFIERYQESVPDANVFGFVDFYNQVIISGDDGKLYQPTDTPDSINIMTVHASKGLEFKYVFVVNCVEGRFPTRRKGGDIELPEDLIHEIMPEGDYHYQEERRLFYVAMTRAKERLYLTSALNYGGVRSSKLSRFVSELDFGLRTSDFKTESITSFGLSSKKKKPAEDTKVVYDLPKRFSYSQISSYQTCPYQYKLSHVLKIPTKGSASFSFGSTIHNTLQKFYERMQELNGLKQDSLFSSPNDRCVDSNIKVPSFEELLEIYEGKWIEDWYTSKRQREDYYKKGKEMLKVFYTAKEGNWNVPVSLESSFKIKVGEYTISGRIDRVDKLEDGTLEIIDYKTGKSKEKLVGDEKDQLLIYQIVASTFPEYKNIGETSKLTFYYLNDNIKTSFIGKEKEIEKLKEKLIKTIERIHERNFTATPSKHICGRCDFRDICDYRV
ncbi:MAG: hypothetical protein COX81_01835 [Candidatus Magasanikbacteria bacterium CG_4_10_14_0_2_um_filter_37_12]|uniref:DNA 3'-5' helicase n=1 Tax=Candidatus Magasanikbacteria bacterium CG_4_10_14_0_2_um_filter_37_12 TaxID=1974637 RepID=A0A2M7V8G6_9BACT|nr:MAG: hypothetical protein COX81_01835 [Candidatus Magasanikbacteria bacterium CG_4_10_14_0_2_um_filter_37_12]